MARAVTAGTSYISIGNIVSLQVATFTYSCWYNFDGTGFGTVGYLMSTVNASSQGPFLYADGQTPPHLGFGATATGVNLLGSHGMPANAWWHLAVTFDGSFNAVSYINGTSESTGTGTGAPAYLTSPVTAFGYAPSPAADPVNGMVADCAIWNIALSGSQISQLANGVRPVGVNSANLIGWWPLDGYASPETDLSSGGHNGTLVGTSRVIGPPPLWHVYGS